MLMFIRIFLCLLLFIFISLVGSFVCLFSPRNPKNVYRFARWFRVFPALLGVRVETRNVYHNRLSGLNNPAIYIANHQNNYDILAAAFGFPIGAVTVGKRSLLYFPFFGLLYWLTGNILIARDNKRSSYKTIESIATLLREGLRSIWMFPEGTRSKGRGLLPFKLGPFQLAIAAGLPIIPVCISNLHKKIYLNRWNNGIIIIEWLPPIHIYGCTKSEAKIVAQKAHQIMQEHLSALNMEVSLLEAKQESAF